MGTVHHRIGVLTSGGDAPGNECGNPRGREKRGIPGNGMHWYPAWMERSDKR